MSNTSNKLAAIIFADIVGYTALMQDGETAAMKLIERFESLTQEYVDQYNGKVIKKYGDGCLLLFDSAVNAVNCAKDLQVRFRDKPAVPLRIGIHVGEVTQKENDVFGHGVNIASRIESMGIPGAVLLSRSAYEKVASHELFRFQSLGSYQFKNVLDSIEVFALTNENLSIPDKKSIKGKLHTPKNNKRQTLIRTVILGLLFLAAFFLGMSYFSEKSTTDETIKSTHVSDIPKNSIAVLPFENMSSGDENKYFAAGMHDDLLTYLSKLKDLKVISRTSVSNIQDSSMSIPEIGELLGVAHVMEGSVRRIDNQARINVQLIEAQSDNHLWAEIYDLNLSTQEIFKTQSEIAKEISNQLTESIFSKESDNDYASYTDNLLAYENYLRAKQLKETGNRESLYEAKSLLETAVELDDQFAEAITLLGNLHIHLVYYAGEDPDVFFPLAWEFMERSLDIKPQLSETHTLKGSLNHWWLGDIKEARKAYEKAIQLNPNNANALYGLAIAIQDLDLNFQEVLALLNKAIAINPLSPNLINLNGVYQRELGNFNEALSTFKKGVKIAPTQPNLWENYSETYYFLGRIDSAAIISHQSMQENTRSGAYLRKYLSSLSNLAMLSELEKEVKIQPQDSNQDKAIKINFAKELYIQKGEFDLADDKLRELKEYNYRWADYDLAEFELYYFSRNFSKAIRIFETYYSDFDFAETSLPSSHKHNLLNYIYCLLQTGQQEKAEKFKQIFKSNKLNLRDTKDLHLQDRKLIDFYNSLYLQIQGESIESIDLLNLFFESGNLYHLRYPELDPIYDSIRDTDQFNLVMNKYRKINGNQKDNFADYLATETIQLGSG